MEKTIKSQDRQDSEIYQIKFENSGMLATALDTARRRCWWT